MTHVSSRSRRRKASERRARVRARRKRKRSGERTSRAELDRRRARSARNREIRAESRRTGVPTRRSRQQREKKTILLNQPQRTRTAKALDIISSTLLEPTTFIRNPAAAGRLVAARRAEIRRTKDIQLAFDVVGETLTSTAVGAAALFGAVNPALARSAFLRILPRTPKAIAASATAGGLLISSPSIRGFVGGVLQDPTRLGRRGGELFEKALKGEDVGGVKSALAKAGLIGGAVAAVVGAGALAKRIFGRGKEVVATGISGSPSLVPMSIAAPSSPAPSPIEEEPVIAETTPALVEKPAAPSVVVNNNIKINNRSSANKRFINHVNL